MKKVFKILLILILVGIVFIAGAVYYVFNKPHRNIKKEKPAYILAARNLIKEYDQDENSAYAKFGNQVIQVSGEIVDISRTGNDVSISLEDEFDGINCALDSNAVISNNDYLSSLDPGDNITLKGKCDGKDIIMGIVFTRCWIVR